MPAAECEDNKHFVIDNFLINKDQEFDKTTIREWHRNGFQLKRKQLAKQHRPLEPEEMVGGISCLGNSAS